MILIHTNNVTRLGRETSPCWQLFRYSVCTVRLSYRQWVISLLDQKKQMHECQRCCSVCGSAELTTYCFIVVQQETMTFRHHNRFTALFLGPPGWAGARRELLDFMVQGKINRGRHTDYPAGRHSIRTNQCLPHDPPIFFTGQIPFLPPNQQHQSTMTLRSV